MNKQEALDIVERLRNAAKAGASIVELTGEAAKDFTFVRDRNVVLGSFGVEVGKKFFVSVASSSTDDEAFQLLIYEKLRGNPVLASSTVQDGAIVWKYSSSKQKGDNKARKKAFLDLVGAPSIPIPLPTDDVAEFSSQIHRAIDLRRQSDAAGGDSDDDDEPDVSDVFEQLYEKTEDRATAARAIAATIRVAHSINPKSWCVTNPARGELIRLNVGVVRVVDLIPGAIRLAVDGSKLDAQARASLGSSLDLERERIPSFGDNGIVTLRPSAFATLPDEVRLAHEAFVRRAAPTVSPFARHHQPTTVDDIEELIGAQLPVPAAAPTRYWKIAPGEQAVNWDECRTGGFIGIGWNKLGDISNLTEEEFTLRAKEQGGSDQVWTFRNIAVGDRIVANQGTKRVLGIGTVTGSYYFDENGGTHKHRLPVRWDDTTEREVLKKGWFKTLIPIRAEDFRAIEGAPSTDSAGITSHPDELPPDQSLTFEAILEQLRAASLTFSAELVASYLLALQAKRFVLLTGTHSARAFSSDGEATRASSTTT